MAKDRNYGVIFVVNSCKSHIIDLHMPFILWTILSTFVIYAFGAPDNSILAWDDD